MGAAEFTLSVEGDDLNALFNEAVENARHTYGHGGYSGSIAEKGGSGVVLIDTVPTKREAYRRANDLLEAEDERVDDKWGPAGAIRWTEDPAGFVLFGWASD